MALEIRRLAPELADDYVSFFDATPHSDEVDDHRCYWHLLGKQERD